MSVLATIGTEMGITLVGGAVAGIWTAFKTTELWRRIKGRRFRRAVRALEAGVETTYREYVARIKASRADGKLTEAEKRRARALAKERAARIAARHGVDAVRVLGEEYVDLWIAKLVKRLKRG